MKQIDEVEIRMKQFYTSGNCRGLSTIYTPKEVRDKMTIHAKEGMKILVMFNYEFCFDLWKLGFKDVMFVSDDELRNEIVEESFGYETKLVDPRSINKNLEGMKFDLIISNPPYNKGLDLKILESILDLSDNICFVHPVGWLLDNTEYFKKSIDRNKLQGRLSSVEMINGNDIFGIGLFMPCAITHFELSVSEIDIIDNSQFFHNNVTSWKTKDIFDIDKYGWHKGYSEIKNKIFNLTSKNPYEKNLNLNFGIASIRGHVGSNDFNTLVQADFEKHIYHSYEFGWNIDKSHCKNLYDYLKLKITRFCLSAMKLHSNNAYFLGFLPWFDFSRSWTDQECAKELGITDEELLWMIQQIPDYYPEDNEIYRKLEKQLKNKI